MNITDVSAFHRFQSKSLACGPLITFLEAAYIEAHGGTFAGLVEDEPFPRFREFYVDRKSAYDVQRRQIIECVLFTDAVGEVGSIALDGPGQIVGYETLLIRRSMSGDEFPTPLTFKISRAQFSHLDEDGLRRLARTSHEYLAGHMSLKDDKMLAADIASILARFSR